MKCKNAAREEPAKKPEAYCSMINCSKLFSPSLSKELFQTEMLVKHVLPVHYL